MSSWLTLGIVLIIIAIGPLRLPLGLRIRRVVLHHSVGDGGGSAMGEARRLAPGLADRLGDVSYTTASVVLRTLADDV